MSKTKREELANSQSCLNRAEDDEPVFVLLGRDPSARAAVLAWIESRLALGKNKVTDRQIEEANEWAAHVYDYRVARLAGARKKETP